MIDLAKEIWQSINTNRLRTLLTGMAVAWGIFMLMMLLGMSQGVINQFSRNFGDNTNMLQIYGGTTTEPYQGLNAGRNVTLKNSNLEAIQTEEGRNVEEICALKSGMAVLATPYDYLSESYSGCFPMEQKRSKITMSEGRFINDRDIQETRKVIVLSKSKAETLFKNPSQALGEKIKFNGIAFTLIGIYDHDYLSTIYIPYTTARAMAGFDNDVGQILVSTKGISTTEESDALTSQIKGTLGKELKFSPTDEGALWIFDRFKNYQETMKGLGILQTAMWVIGILTLLTGIVGVSNIMFVSVKERTHEIGIRRAIGAKPRNILTQIILESVAITALFGYIGILMGTIGNALLDHFTKDLNFLYNPSVTLTLAIEVTLLLVIAGALAGLFPALKALKIRPVEALSTE